MMRQSPFPSFFVLLFAMTALVGCAGANSALVVDIPELQVSFDESPSSTMAGMAASDDPVEEDDFLLEDDLDWEDEVIANTALTHDGEIKAERYKEQQS